MKVLNPNRTETIIQHGSASIPPLNAQQEKVVSIGFAEPMPEQYSAALTLNGFGAYWASLHMRMTSKTSQGMQVVVRNEAGDTSGEMQLDWLVVG